MIVRIPRGDWLIAIPATLVLLVAGTVAAQRPAEGRRAPARLSSAQIFESLGPGPLRLLEPLAQPLHRGAANAVALRGTRMRNPMTEKISDYCRHEHCVPGLTGETKDEVVTELVATFVESGVLDSARAKF